MFFANAMAAEVFRHSPVKQFTVESVKMECILIPFLKNIVFFIHVSSFHRFKDISVWLF